MFELRIPLTLAAITSIKADLTQSLAAVKSSHRVEAVARGLGFQTNAAMRVAVKTNAPLRVNVRWEPFVSYLAEKGFEADATVFFHACARVAMDGVDRAVPRLTIFGIETGLRERNPDGTKETFEQYRDRIAQERAELFESHGIAEFLLSLALLARVKPVKLISHSDSYWVKHIAENFLCTYPHGPKLGPSSVANGALIAAAAHAGFVVREYPGSPNASFNMSKRSLVDLDCQVRPTGAYAQARRRKEEARRSARLRAELHAT
jgi:hypothetical protein